MVCFATVPFSRALASRLTYLSQAALSRHRDARSYAKMMIDTQEVAEAEPSDLPAETEVKAATKAATAKKSTKRKAPAKKVVKTKKPAVKLRPDGLRLGSVGGKLVDAVLRRKGVTHAEACAIVNWKQCLPFLVKSCRQAGVKLRKQKQASKPMRYFGTRKPR
jgi:predicted flap endonuclease-1-like 5' DNA nuclease